MIAELRPEGKQEHVEQVGIRWWWEEGAKKRLVYIPTWVTYQTVVGHMFLQHLKVIHPGLGYH